MHNGDNLHPIEYKFKYFTRPQFACTYQGKLQMGNFTYTICDLQHRLTDNKTRQSFQPLTQNYFSAIRFRTQGIVYLLSRPPPPPPPNLL